MEQPAQRQVTVTVSYFRLKEAGAKLVSFLGQSSLVSAFREIWDTDFEKNTVTSIFVIIL